MHIGLLHWYKRNCHRISSRHHTYRLIMLLCDFVTLNLIFWPYRTTRDKPFRRFWIACSWFTTTLSSSHRPRKVLKTGGQTTGVSTITVVRGGAPARSRGLWRWKLFSRWIFNSEAFTSFSMFCKLLIVTTNVTKWKRPVLVSSLVGYMQ